MELFCSTYIVLHYFLEMNRVELEVLTPQQSFFTQLLTLHIWLMPYLLGLNNFLCF